MLRYFAALGVVVAVAASLFGVLAAGGGNARAAARVTITATNTGSQAPALVTPGPCDTQNGDFTISTASVGVSFACGDGLDEFTNWTFDFTGHARYQQFTVCLEETDALEKATIELRRSNSDSTITDSAGILGKVGVTPLSVGSTGLNLKIKVWPPSSAIIHNWENDKLPAIMDNFQDTGVVTPFNAPAVPTFNATHGQIAMQYQDDALIHFAKLTLRCGTPVGGTVDLLISSDSADSAADVSGSSIASDYTAPAAAAIAAAFVALIAGGWYARRRWLA